MLTSTLILTLGSLTSAIIPSAHCVPVPFDLLATSELAYLPSHSFSSFSLRLFPTSVNSTSLARHAPDLSTSSYLLQRASSDDATRDLITTIRDRRVAIIAQDAIDPLVGNVSDISDWVSTLGQDGKWPDSQIDYATGCAGQRANWPARLHWQRIAFIAAAWHGGIEGAESLANDSKALGAISNAMDFWFDNDFTDSSCLSGQCKCSVKGFWNTNWFSNVIGIPVYVAQSCLLVGPDALTKSQLEGCSRIMDRSVGALFDGVDGMGRMTGANMLDVARVTIDQGLLTNNISVIEQGYKHAHAEVVLRNQSNSDGIRADGSFSQHAGLLYNGNYGKDYANAVLALEIPAGGTQFSAAKANPESQRAYEKLIDADLWMIHRNVKTNVLHWDLSTLNRMISFPVADDQATGSIHIDPGRINQLGELWESDTLKSAFTSLTQPGSDANSGDLAGNRMFYANDYMVQRGPGYVTSLKMYSARTPNSECTNSQNPYGFHLSDGTVYTYLDGTEYEDIAGAWDWNMIPGTTTDYAASKLTCEQSRLFTEEDFVGGASDGQIGAAAMRYKNPETGSLSFQKAWFFLPGDVQHIMIPHVEAKSSSARTPVISVLDQKRLNGSVLVDGKPLDKGGNFSQATTLWHDGVGYKFEQRELSDGSDAGLSVDLGARKSDWSPIGVSTAPESNVNLFSAWISHGSGSDLDSPVAYTAFPAVTPEGFEQKGQQTTLKTIRNDKQVSAVYDPNHHVAMFVFWQSEGGKAMFTRSDTNDVFIMQASGNSVVIYDLEKDAVTVSDPSQKLDQLQLTVGRGVLNIQSFNVTLPRNGEAGKSVTHKL